jgi:triphosphoribosyl-dephospho-CoA synthase
MSNSELLISPQQIAQRYQLACLAEVEAIKPGNVHIFADGHGMTVNDFIKSAEASAAVIAKADLALGERIYHSIHATWAAVGCNTNLGIILLCAPIIQSALSMQLNQHDALKSLRDRLSQTLNETTVVDANWMFKAIQIASPAGLGKAVHHDVNQTADCNLLQAMQASADRDFIGQQYANGFKHLFEEGLIYYQEMLLRWQRPAWATTALYLFWLSQFPDSHIVRKYNFSLATEIKEEALIHFNALSDTENPKQYFPQLLTFDHSLKSRAINPGTSADLTVATLLIQNITSI